MSALRKLAARVVRVADTQPVEPAQQEDTMANEKRFSCEIGGFRYGNEGGPLDRAEMPAYRLNGVDAEQLMAVEGLVLRHMGSLMQELYQLTASASAEKRKVKR